MPQHLPEIAFETAILLKRHIGHERHELQIIGRLQDRGAVLQAEQGVGDEDGERPANTC